MPGPQGLPAAQPPAGAAAPAGHGGYRDWGASDSFSDDVPAGTNGRAIASLILAIVGGGLLSAVLSISALGQIRRRGQKGRGMAIAALVISGGWLVAIAFVVMRPDAPVAMDPAVQRAMQRTSLTPGDCLRSFSDSADAGALSVVPCSDPHAAEVYTVFTFPDGPYPGDVELEEEVGIRCTRSFKPYLAGNESSNLFYLRPSSLSWPLSRQVTCIAVHPESTRTGSLVG